MRALLVLSLLASSVGCGLPLSEGAPKIQNTCDGDEACGPSGSCVEGQCVANSASLAGLIIVVDVPSEISYGGGARHVIAGQDLGLPLQGERSSGFFFPVNLVTSPVAEVTASLSVADATCQAFVESQAYPLQLELQPVGHPTGLGLQSYNTTSVEGSDNRARALVPAGRYDIYVTPALGDDESAVGCVKPPFVLYDRSIPGGSAPLDVVAPETITVTGTIRGYDATGWTVELVENGRGRPVSTKAIPTYDASSESSLFSIETYAEVLFSEQKSSILKLQPPIDEEGVPTVLWSAVPAFVGDVQNGEFALEVSLEEIGKAGNEPRPIEVTVFSETESGVPATVTIQAKALYGGGFGGNLVYRKTVDTDPDGKLTVQLVPGDYVFVAEPLNEALAITTVEKKIDTNNLGTISLELASTRPLEGTTVTPLSQPAFGVQVVLQPPAPSPASFLENQFSIANLKLGGGSTLTNGFGGFSMLVDPGEYDLLLEPDVSTGLPWLLVPRLAVPPAAQPLDPLHLALTHPVVLTGQIRAASNEVLAGAIVRAFVPADGTDSVVQVAEATAGVHGGYRLLLPASASSPSP